VQRTGAKFRSDSVDDRVVPSGPVQIVFALGFLALAVFCEWIIRRSPRYLRWRHGGALRALRAERAMIHLLMTGVLLVALSFLISGIGAL
jgi:hypothetical protein